MRKFNNTVKIKKYNGIVALWEYWDEYLDEDHILLDITTQVPDQLFDPYKISISIPEEFIQPNMIKSDVTKLEVPIEVEGTTENVTIKENIKYDKFNNLLSLIKVKIFGDGDV